MDLPAREIETGSCEEDDLAEATVAHSEHSRSVQDLAVRAQSGCAVAFAELHKRLHPRLIRFLEKNLASTCVLAEDVAAETLARAWQAIDSFDPRYQFVTWVYTIATRKAADHVRAAKRKQLSPLPADIPSASDTPSASLEKSEALGTIWAVAQNALSDDQYAALWLRFGEDLSITEVAQVLGKTTVGVRVLLHRGRFALQKALQREHGQVGSAAAPAQDQLESHRPEAEQDGIECRSKIDGRTFAKGKIEDQQHRGRS